MGGELRALAPAAVVSSDLLRARQTAAAVAAAAGVAATIDRRLREVDLGTWEGLLPVEVERRLPDEFAAWTAGADIRRGGGESLAGASRRAAPAVLEALDRVPGPVVVVSHGLVLRATLDRLAGEGRIALEGPAPHLANAAWVLVQRGERSPRH